MNDYRWYAKRQAGPEESPGSHGPPVVDGRLDGEAASLCAQGPSVALHVGI